MKLPLSLISFATCAYRGSSGAQRSLFPMLNRKRNTVNTMIETTMKRVL
ncbi:MAG: hypothetical protein JETT_2386 [Candidatus Jettenia ecosi]|uniref:Uncharacterized protein n=1 Tax=Candidatus Jettenia ecosi TaxID=2494326 RepID=A0A533Q9G0_9BACT|nr:MAG: hypothetical protein JETT_2386 [Candidatus Jettenia ecosi]